jgi:hypothetical protein
MLIGDTRRYYGFVISSEATFFYRAVTHERGLYLKLY